MAEVVVRCFVSKERTGGHQPGKHSGGGPGPIDVDPRETGLTHRYATAGQRLDKIREVGLVAYEQQVVSVMLGEQFLESFDGEAGGQSLIELEGFWGTQRLDYYLGRLRCARQRAR